MTSGNLVEPTEMCEARRSNLASIWPLTSITYNENAHLSLGCLDSRICLSRRDSITFGEQQEMVDQCLHVLLHRCTGRRRDFVVFYANWPRWHLVQTLVDNSERLPKLLHTTEVPVVAITVYANRHIKFNFAISIIRLALSDIPRYTRSTKHNTSE